MVITITQVGAVPGDRTKMQERDSTVTFATDSGTVDVFTISGRVFISLITAHCITSLTESGSVTSLELGGATDDNYLIEAINPSTLVANTWWIDGTAVGGGTQINALQVDAVTDEDIIITIKGGTAVATGAIVFTVHYLPLTDGATLTAG